MSLFSYVGSLFQNFPRNADLNDELSTKNITDLQSSLYKFINTKSGLSLSEADDNFHSQLCIFRNQLENNQYKSVNPEIKKLCLQIKDQLHIAIVSDIKYVQACDIYNLLCNLSISVQKEHYDLRRKKLFYRRIFLISVLFPLSAAFIHYFNGNFLQSMTLDEVHIIYPPSSYEYRDDTYQIKESLVEESLTKFSRYFFKSYILNHFTEDDDVGIIQSFSEGDERELVKKKERDMDSEQGMDSKQILNRIFASGYDIENDLLDLKNQDSPLIAKIIDEVKTTDSFHLTKFRVFLKNIKNNNVVNNLEVQITKIEETSFPWDKIKLDAALEFGFISNDDDDYIMAPKIYVYALNAPVIDLEVDISAYDQNLQVGITYSDELEDIIYVGEEIKPEFGLRLGAIDKSKFATFYVSSEKKSKFNFDPRYSLSVLALKDEGFTTLLKRYAVDGNLDSFPYFYKTCPDEGIILFGRNENLANLLSLNRINEFKIDYIYKLANGKTISNVKTYAPNKNIFIFDNGISYDFEELALCGLNKSMLGNIQSTDIERISVTTGPKPLQIISDFDALALHVMDTDNVPISSIEKEVTMIFAEFGDERVMSQSVDIPGILHDGNYLMTDLWIVNFQGGDYTFSFYLDNQNVGETNINIFWPTFLDYDYYIDEFFTPK
jgi:hypothetical protein